MTAPPRWTTAAVLGATAALLGVIAYLLLWTSFMVYDDEGYVLYSLKAYAMHGHLYSDVYSQYGPFYFVLYRTLHAVGFAFDNTSARAATLVCWVGTAMACSALVWRATNRKLVPALATLVAVFLHLSVMTSEPSHPGGFIALVVALAAWWITRPGASSTRRAVVIGTAAAMLLLTKVNVGLLWVVSVGAWWLLQFPTIRASGVGRAAVAALVALVPIALMWSARADMWVPPFMAITSLGGAGLVLCTTGAAEPVQVRDLPIALAIGGIILVVVSAVVLAGGTPLPALADGIVLGPLRHPSVYRVPMNWRPGTLILGFACFALAMWLSRQPVSKRRPILLALRSVVVLAYALVMSGHLPILAPGFVLSFGLGTTVLLVLPTRENDPLVAIRALLGFLLVFQSLHAFPVAGSQVAWGTYLWVPLAVLAVTDLASDISSRAFRLSVAAGTVGAATLFVASTGFEAVARYRGSDALAVPGAENIRMPETFSTAIRTIVHNASYHGDTVFSLPGMMSFNTWTRHEPPTVANATHWFNLLSAAQQTAIHDRLSHDPRSVVVVQRYVYDLLAQQGFLHGGPLLDWIRANYTPAFRLESYEFWIRRDRHIAALDTAALFVGTGPLPYKLVLTLAPATPIQIASIELRGLYGDGSQPVAQWQSGNSRVFLQPLHDDGTPDGNPAECRYPFELERLTQFSLFAAQFPTDVNPSRAVVYLRDAQGRVVAQARFVE